jgi:predicted alpha/beta-fold hydrolase
MFPDAPLFAVGFSLGANVLGLHGKEKIGRWLVVLIDWLYFCSSIFRYQGPAE